MNKIVQSTWEKKLFWFYRLEGRRFYEQDFANTEGYIPKKKRHVQDKVGKLATVKLATETLQVPRGGELPIIPNSLEAWTKKTQMCTTEIHHEKHDPDQIEKLNKKLKESREKAKNLAIQNENMMEINEKLELQNENMME